MPQPHKTQKLMANYFCSIDVNAYQYPYQFPGFVGVMQTAGRVIHSESEGVLSCMLSRLDYRNLMRATPLEFFHKPSQLVERIQLFGGLELKAIIIKLI